MGKRRVSRIDQLHHRYGVAAGECGACGLYFERRKGWGCCQLIDEERWKANWAACAKFEIRDGELAAALKGECDD